MSVALFESTEVALKNKAKNSGIPLGILRQVFGEQATDLVLLSNNGQWPE